MKFFSKGKDGGPESSVTGYWLVEIKDLFSIVLLKLEGQSRDAYHEHAFHAVSWLLRGRLIEFLKDGTIRHYKPSWLPFLTKKTDFHMVHSVGVSWALSFRGPWNKTWKEYIPSTGKQQTLTHGREIVQ